MIKTLLLIVAFHLIGAIVMLVIHYKDGTLEYAALYGDGIRNANPSDIIFADLVLWELGLLLCVAFVIEEKINEYFQKKFKENKHGKIYN